MVKWLTWDDLEGIAYRAITSSVLQHSFEYLYDKTTGREGTRHGIPEIARTFAVNSLVDSTFSMLILNDIL